MHVHSCKRVNASAFAPSGCRTLISLWFPHSDLRLLCSSHLGMACQPSTRCVAACFWLRAARLSDGGHRRSKVAPGKTASDQWRANGKTLKIPNTHSPNSKRSTIPINELSGHFASGASLTPHDPTTSDAIRTIAAEAKSKSWSLGYMPGTIHI